MSIYIFRNCYRKRETSKTKTWISDGGALDPSEGDILDNEVFLVMSSCTT